MKTVKEISTLYSISIRTLHHYDAIGLLKPAKVTSAGYRLYGNAEEQRLQTILIFRELQFPLKDIQKILDAPGFDPIAALDDQIHLLELQKSHLEQLISHAKNIQKTGVITMKKTVFDKSKQERYAAEAKMRWGSTDAYREYTSKTAGKTASEMSDAGTALMEIFTRIGALRQSSPDDPAVQALIAELQQFITDHYYTCTREILRGLGQMYAAEGEMKDNIDQAGGEGTGLFAKLAIDHYCK